MSKESKSRWPDSSPACAAASAPAAGPDSSKRTGKRAAVSRVAMPPLDSMTKKLPAKPILSNLRLQLREIIRHPFLNVDVGQRRAGPLELADLGHHFRTERHAHLGRYFGDDLRRALLMRGIAKTVEVANADGFDAFVAQLADQAPDKRFVQDCSTLPSAAMRSGTSKRRWRGTRGFGSSRLQIVEFVAVLAADLDGVAKTRRRKQRRRRALALDQRVGHQVVPWIRCRARRS